jgi:hypothetical protein
MHFQDFAPGRTPLGYKLNASNQPTAPQETKPVAASLPPSTRTALAVEPDEANEQSRLGLYRLVKTTAPSEFGLYKRFQSPEEQPYDPDAAIKPKDFCDFTPAMEDASKPENFHPFPNRNAFLLGEWRSSDGDGKSREGFARLLDIISSETWDPKDVQGLNWKKIDSALAGPTVLDDGDESWADESSWKTSTVTINVPFNTKCETPGPHPFQVQFRHRPIIPMIRDKLMNQRPSDQFHFLPFETRWCPGEGKDDVKVYGELYSSPAFLQAFNALQVFLLSTFNTLS